MKKLGAVALFLMVFSVAFARDGAVNKVCPIKGTPVKDGGPSSSYMGKTIGFC